MQVLRPLDLERDLDRAADLLSHYWPRRFTAATMREREAQRPPETIHCALIAVDGADQPIGYGWVSRSPWTAPGEFSSGVVVAPDHRRRGIGHRLYAELATQARERGGTVARAYLRDNRPAALAFARRHGLDVERHEFTSVLDLSGFDESAFAPVVTKAEAAGFRFFSLAEAGFTAESRHSLHALHRQTAADVPGTHDDFPTFAAYEQQLLTSRSHRPEGLVVAASGDEWVGLAAVTYDPAEDAGQAYNAHTGVLRQYRGRGVAQALKVLAVRAARAMGARSIRTDNDEENAPMLAINRKLGYVPSPGWYRVRGAL